MKLYRQVLLLTLALLVLVSSTGMAVGMHICGGELRDVTFFGAKADCPMEQKQQANVPPCHAAMEKHPDAKDACCQDHQLTVKQLDDASSHEITSLTQYQQLQLFTIVKAVVLQFYASQEAEAPRFALYESPPLARNIPVLVQSFLL